MAVLFAASLFVMTPMAATAADRAPETTITEGPTGEIETGEVSFEFESDLEESTFECSMDDAVTFTKCETPKVYSLGYGEHTFRVKATSVDLIEDESPDLQGFTVLTPQTTITSGPGPGAIHRSTYASFEFQSDIPGSTFLCSMNAPNDFTSCVTSQSFGPLSSGASHKFMVKAVSPEGLEDQSPESRTFTIDANNPETSINPVTGTPTNKTSSRGATFAFSANEPATFWCRLDSAPSLTECSSQTISYTDLALGAHVFAVYAIDTAGNYDPSPQEWNWTIYPTDDWTPPTDGAVHGSVFDNAFTTKRPFKVSWSATDAGSGVASYDIRYTKTRPDELGGNYVYWKDDVTPTSSDFTGAPGFTYRFSMTATDADGNTSLISNARGVSLPFDDKALEGSDWSRQTNKAGNYLGTISAAKIKGRELRMDDVTAQQFALLATKCPGCGTVKVFLDETLLKRVSLANPTVKKRKLIPLKAFDSFQSGDLRIKIASKGKKVQIDGLGLSGP